MKKHVFAGFVLLASTALAGGVVADDTYIDETQHGMGAAGAQAQQAAYDATAAQKDADAAPDAADKAKTDATANQKDADSAPDAADKAKQQAQKNTGVCTTPDYTSDNPQSTGSSCQAVAAFGGDARAQNAYYPPKNPKINGTTLSWAKLESFKQLAKAKGYSDNAIAGMAGRLQVESRAFQLNQWKYENGKSVLTTSFGASAQGDKMNGRFTSFGIAQYHNSRGVDMGNTVGASSLTPSGLQGTTNAQYEYLFNDLQKNYKSTYNALQNDSISVNGAAQVFTSKYEIPASQAGQAFGLAGGTATVNNANGILSAMNQTVIPDGSNWGSSYTVTGKAATGNSVTGNSGLGTTVDGLISSLTGGNTGSVGSLLSSLGINTTGSNASSLLAQAMSALTSGSSSGTGTTSTGTTASSSSSSTKTKTSTTTTVGLDRTVTVITYSDGTTETTVSRDSTQTAYVAALAAKCGKDLPSSEDAKTLMVRECQVSTAVTS